MAEDLAGREDDFAERAEQEQRRFGADLDAFRIEHGAPSMSSLANPRVVGMSKGNLSPIFGGERLPSVDVTRELVRAIAKDVPDEERRGLEKEWRQRWQTVQQIKSAAGKAARRAQAANSRAVGDTLAAARQQAKQIIAAAEERAGEFATQAQADAEKLRSEVRDRVDADVARLTEEAVDDNAAVSVLMLAQQTCDMAIAEARNEANKIVGEAHRRATQLAAGLTTEQQNALAEVGYITGAVNYCLPEGLLLQIVAPTALAGTELYVHTGAEIAANVAPGYRASASMSPLLTHPVLVAKFEGLSAGVMNTDANS